MIPEWIIQVGSMVATGAGIYAAIRADLAALHVKADMASASAHEAHERIDRMLEGPRR